MSDYDHDDELAAFTDRVLGPLANKLPVPGTPEEELVLRLRQIIRPQEDLSLPFRHQLNSRVSEAFEQQKKIVPLKRKRFLAGRSIYAVAAVAAMALIGLSFVLSQWGEGAAAEGNTATARPVSPEIFAVFLLVGALVSLGLWWWSRPKD